MVFYIFLLGISHTFWSNPYFSKLVEDYQSVPFSPYMDEYKLHTKIVPFSLIHNK